MMLQLVPQLCGYRIIASLGRGGMAHALLAMRDGPSGFRKLFVLKQLKPELCGDFEFIEMFLEEARLAALMNHPNVVQTHGIETDGGCFLSMDYLEGQSLAALLKKTRREIPLHLHVHILAETLAGLHYAHELTSLSGERLFVVHRDVSPGNIFVTYAGDIKLLDFGIAKATSSSDHETRVGRVKGKLAYMAPEQAAAKATDRRADVFSVGVLLWEALAGQRMVARGENEVATLFKRINGAWLRPSELRQGLPAALVDACNRAMSVAPSDRFSSAAEFGLILCDYVAELCKSPRTELANLIDAGFATERQHRAAEISQSLESGVPADLNRPVDSGTFPASSAVSRDKEALDEWPELTVQRPTRVKRNNARAWAFSFLALAIIVSALLYLRSRGTANEPANDESLSMTAGSSIISEIDASTPAIDPSATAEGFESATKTVGFDRGTAERTRDTKRKPSRDKSRGRSNAFEPRLKPASIETEEQKPPRRQPTPSDESTSKPTPGSRQIDKDNPYR